MNRTGNMFVFPLIGEKKPIPYIIILIIWNLGIVLGMLSIFFRGDIKFNIFLSTFLISTIIWVIGNLLIKKYKLIGNIALGSDIIKIDKATNTLNINIFETKGLILKYCGAKGDSYGAYAGLLRVKDGSGNTISFEYEGEPYKLEFLVTKKHFLNSVYWILKAWRDHNVDFKILNQNKEDITTKVLNRQGQY